jgi:mannosyl-oligosaccharide alpha-1,2-mannosidase
MLRFRRYRVFVFVAVVFTLLVVQLKHFGEWSPYSQSPNLTSPQSPKDGDLSQAKSDTPPVVKVPAKDVPHTSIAPIPKTTTTTTKVKATSTKSPSAETPSKVVLPDRKPVPPTKVHDLDKEEDGIHPIPPPGRQELPTFPSVPKVIHWEKQVEHFPVPKESIITLPTGSPKAIPKIQYKFDDETPDAKHDREKRQNMVKAEFKKAWTGYKTKAWLHDELSPVSGKFRDPFCGWAATLVDTLDTLWIMGLQEEFEEAAKAVDQIDFTTSPRADIPVFETTIRYLGGLLAAYDVSGAAYKNLLDKAVELAEILMGIFDTPNRMPDLYYRWKPTFASQAHRAGVRSNLAELGSLSMEFTRLAQITRDPRYYDAVARITLALSEWQDRGTMLDGVFPDNVDASGCNRTEVAKQAPYSNEKDPVLVPAQVNEEPIGFQPTTKSNKPSPATDKTIRKSTSESGQVESKVASGDSGKIGTSKKLAKRLSEGMPPVNQTLSKSTQPTVDPITGLPLDIPAAKAKIGSTVGNWDCVPQGLEPASPYGMNKFSMGGGQDSTYEYFPKACLIFSFLC